MNALVHFSAKRRQRAFFSFITQQLLERAQVSSCCLGSVANDPLSPVGLPPFRIPGHAWQHLCPDRPHRALVAQVTETDLGIKVFRISDPELPQPLPQLDI